MATIFSGNSRYATDFQQVIDRAVAIASLPLAQLQTQRETLSGQETAWTSLNSRFTALQTSLERIATSMGGASYAASVANPQVLTARLGTQPSEGNYTIEVVSSGRRTSTFSAEGLPRVTNPSTQSISSSGNFSLVVDGASYNIVTSDTSLSALAAQINSSNAPVVATIVNVGTSQDPDYRLAVQSTKLGDISISMTDGTTLLLNTLVQGYSAKYRINGYPNTPIESDTRTVSIGPGLDVDLLQAGTTEIEVQRSSSAIRDALSEFITSFNAIVDEVDTHRGQANGALAGQSLLSTITKTLRQIAGYSFNGAIDSLASIGITFDQFGKLSLDATTFDHATAGKVPELMSFLGSEDSGGLLKLAGDLIKGLQDSGDGELANAITLAKAQVKSQDELIAANQERVQLLRDNLLQKMGIADALIATLEQQVSYMNGLFEAMKAQRDA